MVTTCEYDDDTHTFFCRVVDADAISGDLVFEGIPTADDVRERANDELAAPDCGDFSDAKVEFEEFSLPILHAYAEAEIERLGLGDSETNCHGVVATLEEGGVRLGDGVGLDVLCTTKRQADAELKAMADWYAESEQPS